jgi:L-2-hydroxyglutarate oxidase LhgO
MVAGAAEFVPTATLETFTDYGRAGIRAQLVRTADLALVQDYVLVGDAYSTHVLNAVSPAWTCSRPFAELVVEGIMKGTIPRTSNLEQVGTIK